MSTTPTTPTFQPYIDKVLDPHLRTLLNLAFGKIDNHYRAINILAKRTGTTQQITNIISGGGGGGGGGGSSSAILVVNNQSGQTAYTTKPGDNGVELVLSDASPIAVTLGAGITSPWGVFITNQGAGTATITPASGTISYFGNPGAASMPLLGGYGTIIAFDGTNFFALTMPIVPVNTPALTAGQYFNAYNSTTGVFGSSGPLSGTSASLGGSAMTAGQRVTVTVTITGATTSMCVMTSPQTDPGAGFVWHAFVSAANTVTVCLTCVAAGTPTASLYSVRVLQ